MLGAPFYMIGVRIFSLHDLLPSPGGTLGPSAPSVRGARSLRSPICKRSFDTLLRTYLHKFLPLQDSRNMPQTQVIIELEPPISIGIPPLVNQVLAQAPSAPSSELRRNIAVSRAADLEPNFLPHGRSIIVIAALTGVNFLSSMSTGLLTVGLPRMAVDVKLPANLLLWYERDSSTLLSL